MNHDKLPEATKIVLEQLRKDHSISNYVLIGGSAIALHSGHRISEDLDFATHHPKLNRLEIDGMLKRMHADGKEAVLTTDSAAIVDSAEEGIDLLDYQQDYLIDGVKVTFFAFGDSDKERRLISEGHAAIAPGNPILIANMDTLFITKCMALVDRNASRDLFDLWWMTHFAKTKKPVSDIFKVIQEYRPHYSYDLIRSLLLNRKIFDCDPGFSNLTTENITVEKIRADFENDIAKLEKSIANKVPNFIDALKRDPGHIPDKSKIKGP